jgi:hypothetical protein
MCEQCIRALITLYSSQTNGSLFCKLCITTLLCAAVSTKMKTIEQIFDLYNFKGAWNGS